MLLGGLLIFIDSITFEIIFFLSLGTIIEVHLSQINGQYGLLVSYISWALYGMAWPGSVWSLGQYFTIWYRLYSTD